MDKLENKHNPEAVPDFESKPHKQPSETDFQGNLQQEQDTQSWPKPRWNRLVHWLKSSTITPEWLPAPWNHPLSGFICAILIPVVSILVTLLLKHIFLTFVFPGVLIIISILIVAFLWGTGPGLLATVWGTAIFNLSVLSPQFSLSLNTISGCLRNMFSSGDWHHHESGDQSD